VQFQKINTVSISRREVNLKPKGRNMLRRKFMQLIIVASSSSALATIGSTARASGGASNNDGGASRNDGGASRNDGGASRNDGGASRNDGGASIGHSGTGETHSGGASVYCATDATGQQTCQQETYDGLSTVTDSDLDDVLKSFN
jgi:hypothetical protein